MDKNDINGTYYDQYSMPKEIEKDTFKAPSGKEIEIYAIKHGSMRIVFDHLDKKAIAHLTKVESR